MILLCYTEGNGKQNLSLCLIKVPSRHGHFSRREVGDVLPTTAGGDYVFIYGVFIDIISNKDCRSLNDSLVNNERERKPNLRCDPDICLRKKQRNPVRRTLFQTEM